MLRRLRVHSIALRPLAVVAIALTYLAIAGLGAVAVARAAMSERMERTAAESAVKFSTLLNQVERELIAVDAAVARRQCQPVVARMLDSAARDSLLVREFLVPTGGGNAPICASSTPILPDSGGLQQSLATSTVHLSHQAGSEFLFLRARIGESKSNALVDVRQLLDRLPRGTADFNTTLVSTESRSAISHSARPQANRGFSTTTGQTSVPGWPLSIELVDVRDRWLKIDSPMIALWAAIGILLSIITTAALNRVALQRFGRERQLHFAVTKRRVAAVVQPIISSRTGRCIGVEALARLRHPFRGLIPPEEFIEQAERSGLIGAISEMVMKMARDQLTKVGGAGSANFFYSFNVTAAQLRSPDFADRLQAIFDGNPIGPEQIVLELTEREFADARVHRRLRRLRRAGFRVAIDDFGTGHSTLSLLQTLKVDHLKIDRAFVASIVSGRDVHPVLDSIIGLAQRLKIEVIAEGVETEVQRDYLSARGVGAIQGFLASQPLLPPEFERWLRHHGPAPQPAAHNLAGTCFAAGHLTPELVADALRSAPELSKDRWYRVRLYRDVLRGDEMVTWCARSFGISRALCARLGQQLLANGHLIHVAEEHDFRDGNFFYRLLSKSNSEDPPKEFPNPSVSVGQATRALRGSVLCRPGTRASGLFAHDDAVTGSELATALMSELRISRAEAIDIGASLVRAGRVRHVFDSSGFVDSTRHVYWIERSAAP